MAPSLSRIRRTAAERSLQVQLDELRTEVERNTPYSAYEYVTVTFGSANTDRDIRHSLRPLSPENIHYQLVESDRSTTIYHDQTGTRRAWGPGYIVLRSSVASAVVTLLLTVPRS